MATIHLLPQYLHGHHGASMATMHCGTSTVTKHHATTVCLWPPYTMPPLQPLCQHGAPMATMHHVHPWPPNILLPWYIHGYHALAIMMPPRPPRYAHVHHVPCHHSASMATTHHGVFTTAMVHPF